MNRGPELKIAVLATGSELLSGERSDTNSARIARLLGSAGFRLSEVRVVDDREEEIARALAELAGRYQLVIVTGGLGPTADDLTARAAARACQRRLTLNDEALQLIRRHFQRLKREMHPGNEKQALLPHKCRVLPNNRGTAPGFQLQLHEAELYFLPGVPDEMAAMVEELILPELQRGRPAGLALQEKIVRVFGLAEPQIEEQLQSIDLPREVELAYGASFPQVAVKLRATGSNAALLERAERQIMQVLGDYVFGRGDETLPGNVCRQLAELGVTLSLAESCTGGMIAKLLTDNPGASAFLERGAVTYANSSKHDWLQVPAETLEQFGAVSSECASAMARGIRRAARTDLGLAVTGIAGPDGGTPDKPVGTVFIALVSEEDERVERLQFGGSRERVRVLTSYTALDWLRRYALDHLEQ